MCIRDRHGAHAAVLGADAEHGGGRHVGADRHDRARPRACARPRQQGGRPGTGARPATLLAGSRTGTRPGAIMPIRPDVSATTMLCIGTKNSRMRSMSVSYTHLTLPTSDLV